jgi:hypothetical protein
LDQIWITIGVNDASSAIVTTGLRMDHHIGAITISISANGATVNVTNGANGVIDVNGAISAI